MSILLSFYNSHRKCMKLTNNFARNIKQVYFNKIKQNEVRCFSQVLTENNQNQTINSNEKPNKFIPFLQEINFRRDEAKRSILVQVQSSQSYKELHSYCSSIGHVKQMFHYSSGVEQLHFILVEFEKEADVKNILSSSTHVDDSLAVPTHSQFLWFRASNKKLGKIKASKNALLASENGTEVIKEAEVMELLQNCETISDQMTVLHNSTKLNEVGRRLRYLTARQIEQTVSGIFPYAAVLPFGSSVNGCGKMGCDLDLVLRLNDTKVDDTGRLIFHCKASSGSERSISQRHMETIGDIIHYFLPGCSQVRRILQARVPIIKYHHHLTDLECDLSMTNMSGVHMSDFLYIMGSIDPRVRPLIFTVRKWASVVGLTNSSPGRWITNFSLTLLVLSFLQKPLNSEPILPSLNTLVKLAGPNDQYITEDGINCTFLRDINLLNTKTKNTETLSSLLAEFFEYYSQFDFSSKAICLNEPVALTKPEHNALYIVNPLERGLNVSKNVSLEELEKFKLEVRNAAWILESQEDKSSKWGLLSLFEKKSKPSQLQFAFSAKHNRLMEVSTLFDEESKEELTIEFKNDYVRNQVEGIKKDTHQKIKSTENSIKRHNRQR